MFLRSRSTWALSLACAGAVSLFAMAPPDTIQGTGGPITIQPITHAAVQVNRAQLSGAVAYFNAPIPASAAIAVDIGNVSAPLTLLP